MKDPVIIVGAGLSGLHAASLLVSKGVECKVLEASERIGGRVLSSYVDNRPELGKFDLGPTWFWPKYEPVISELVSELGLKTMEQHTEGAVILEQSQDAPVQRHVLPEGTMERSVRLAGGIGTLVDALANRLPTGIVNLNTSVTAIHMDNKETITLEAACVDGEVKHIRASAVILALPPRLIADHITFSSSLSPELMNNLKSRKTWMAEQAKAIAVYDRPFWREDGLSGQAMSWAGPLQEIHDASPDTGYGAIFGFFGIPAKTRQEMGEESVLELVTNQLIRLFGPSAETPISLLYKDWSSDPETAADVDTKPLTHFPDYGQLKGTDPWGEKLIFAGTETAADHGGHLEGALVSAERAVFEVLEWYKAEQ